MSDLGEQKSKGQPAATNRRRLSWRERIERKLELLPGRPGVYLMKDAAGKILAGNGDQVVRCDECMTCFATIGSGKPMGCKVNRNLPGSPHPV